MPTDMKQDCGEVKQKSGGVVIPTWLFVLMCINAVIWFANKCFDLINGTGDRGAETVYVVEKRAGSDCNEWREAKGVTVNDGGTKESEPNGGDGGEYEKGGIVVCFGCREVYWREPIWAVWHTQFCPRCCKDGDARWNEDNIQLWKQLQKILRKDVRNDDRWVAAASGGVRAANWEQTVRGFQPKATAMSGKQTKGM